MASRLHWRLPPGGERPDVLLPGLTDRKKVGLPDLEARAGFCRRAEEMGIDSVLTAFASNMPDTMLLAAALAPLAEKIKFIVAYRPGLLSPTLFVQQVNTLSTLTNGRVSLNIVIGHSQQEQAGYGDFLSHDERYERADEFLAICNELWRGESGVNFGGRYYRIENGKLNTPFASEERNSPELFMAGGSPQAQVLAVKHASCWLSLGDRPETLRSRIRFAVEEGIEAGLRFSIIAKSTREEAIEAAEQLVHGRAATDQRPSGQGRNGPDGGPWLTQYLWNGAVAAHGASAIALVGSREDVASAILEYRELGVSQFILSGWPNLEAMSYFGREILPLIRMKESGSRVAVEQASAAD